MLKLDSTGASNIFRKNPVYMRDAEPPRLRPILFLIASGKAVSNPSVEHDESAPGARTMPDIKHNE